MHEYKNGFGCGGISFPSHNLVRREKGQCFSEIVAFFSALSLVSYGRFRRYLR